VALSADRRPAAKRRSRRSTTVTVAALAGALLSVLPAQSALADHGQDAGGHGSFATSFEPAGSAPDWQSTPDSDRHGRPAVSAVYPDSGAGLPGSAMSQVSGVTASGDVPPDHTASAATDGDPGTSWQAASRAPSLTLALKSPATITTYAMTSASDWPERDPKSWQLQGTTDGRTWRTLDTESGQSFGQRSQTRLFTIRHAGSYAQYRLAVSANNGDSDTQLGELALAAAPSAQPGMTASIGDGPASSPTAKTHAGFTGTHALHYAGWQLGGHGTARDKVYQVSLPVRRDTRLSYDVFPELTGRDLGYPSTYVSVDLAFSDGTYLSDLGATDQYGKALSPRGQGEAKVLQSDQWNAVTADIGRVAAGKTITRVLVGYDNPAGPAHFSGWLDDISLAQAPPGNDCAHPSTCVITTRGTNSSGDYSRGNDIPATALPHGFNFWTPVTDAGSTGTEYAYQRGNDAANEPELQALSLSHEPSIWVADHQTFQVMPSTLAAPTSASRTARALPFSHANETARADYYGVTFDNGLRAEMTPTDHAAVMRFTFPAGDGSLLFDNVNDNGGLTVDRADGVVSGYTDVAGFYGAPRMFVYATFDRPMTGSGTLPDGGGSKVSGYAGFDLGADRQLTMRIATSAISLDQAKHNLALEIGGAGFDQVHAAAQKAWDTALGVIKVGGAGQDQLTSLYSSLYRLNLYPDELFENTGSAAAPVYQYASPYSPGTGQNTATATGSAVKNGKPYANEGFWDTYRTAWSLDSLLYPKLTGEMIDGFVQQYRDGGWIGQWTAPGYLGFSGTNSDAAIADAYLRGVTNFDVRGAYEAAVKDATIPSSGITGRPDVQHSTFLGYTPQSDTSSASVSLEDYLADYGIAQMSLKLSQDAKPGDPHRREYQDNYTYFSDRAQHYTDLFDPSVGFFQPRDADGTFEQPASSYNPLSWNATDYTEGDGWTYAFAVPEDGNGLAALYGGRAGLAGKLDQFFATPETAQYGGSWLGPYHEMFESRDDRIGQWAFNDQPSMHVPYMYDYVGQPAKAAEHVRDAESRLFTGSTIGQGYPGDEDNGSMSAFYIDNALGLYPLQQGSPTWVVGSPLYDRATIRPIGGHTVTITADHNSDQNIYVQSMRVNGRSSDLTYVRQSDLTRGGSIDFRMGPRPSSWGTKAADAPPSPTKGSRPADPPSDLTGPGKGTATATGGTDPAPLFDNTSTTAAAFPAGPASVGYRFDQPRHIDQYTLTSAAQSGGDPASWTVSVSADGTHWKVIDRRSGEQFAWRQQTKAFSPAEAAGSYQYVRIDFDPPATGSLDLSEVEMLG
jgi:predicted alpha-1,2-mannosidase